MLNLRLAMVLAGTCSVLSVAPLAGASEHMKKAIDVEMHKVSADGVGASIGTITLMKNEYGVLIRPDLDGLEPGLHGFHLHQNPDCSPAAKSGTMTAAAAAGGHFDPKDTGEHHGPFSDKGHLGDLPALYVNESNHAGHPVLAPRLELSDFPGHALVIHKGGDNYSDQPEPLGGGGARVACGVIPE